MVANKKTKLISALGAIPKKDGKIRRILANMGHLGIVCYLHDLLIVADTHAECLETMSVLQKKATCFGLSY